MSDTVQNGDTKTYLDNYRILEQCARELSEQDTPDVDAIIPAVEKSVAAYDACMERIKSAEQMLEKISAAPTN